MLPPPSVEQARALAHFREGKNVVVTAVAGAGKSTMLLHACAAYPDDEVCVVAYNAPLAAEMNDLLAAAGLTKAAAYTFHSLASAVFRLCPDDNTMYDLVQEAHRGEATPKKFLTPSHLLLDEMQDMRDLYWELLNLAFDLPRTHTLVCGDPEQMLYDFEQDDPAKLDYLQRPGDFFGSGEWVAERLSVSFRLTPPVAALANAVKDGEPLVAGNGGDAPPPMVITCGMFEWSDKLIPVIRTWLQTQRYPPSRIAILARTVRTAHPAVRTFVNNLVAAGVPVYVHGVDAAHARVRKGKVTVATYYAAKGLTFDACLTLGAADGVEANPMYVAMSRSRCRQVVAMDRMRPPRKLLDAMRSGEVRALACAHTRRAIYQSRKDDKGKEEQARAPPALRDVTQWAPRGRAPDVHASIGTAVVSLVDLPSLPIEVFAGRGEGENEVPAAGGGGGVAGRGGGGRVRSRGADVRGARLDWEVRKAAADTRAEAGFHGRAGEARPGRGRRPLRRRPRARRRALPARDEGEDTPAPLLFPLPLRFFVSSSVLDDHLLLLFRAPLRRRRGGECGRRGGGRRGRGGWRRGRGRGRRSEDSLPPLDGDGAEVVRHGRRGGGVRPLPPPREEAPLLPRLGRREPVRGGTVAPARQVHSLSLLRLLRLHAPPHRHSHRDSVQVLHRCRRGSVAGGVLRPPGSQREAARVRSGGHQRRRGGVRSAQRAHGRDADLPHDGPRPPARETGADVVGEMREVSKSVLFRAHHCCQDDNHSCVSEILESGVALAGVGGHPLENLLAHGGPHGVSRNFF